MRKPIIERVSHFIYEVHKKVADLNAIFDNDFWGQESQGKSAPEPDD